MAQYSRNLFPANPGKPFQEIVNAGTVLKVLKERFDGHTSPSENPGSAHTVRFSFDLGTFVPQHVRNQSIMAPQQEGQSQGTVYMLTRKIVGFILPIIRMGQMTPRPGPALELLEPVEDDVDLGRRSRRGLGLDGNCHPSPILTVTRYEPRVVPGVRGMATGRVRGA